MRCISFLLSLSAALALELRPRVLSRGAVLRDAAAAVCVVSAPTVANAIPPPDMLAAAPGASAQLKEQAPMVLYTPPSIKGASSADQLALAEHLKRTGAKFYGAYWCSFCLRQRSMFGAGAARVLPYVECAEDGYQSEGATCRKKKEVTGYPTWEINGKFYGGMQTLQRLQALSGFDASVKFPEYVPPPPPPRPPPPPGGYKPPQVQTTSTSEQLALARHLKASGAKFYGAYWCRFCGQQRTMFGAEAVAALPYVECAADGYQSASAACRSKQEVSGYPTWEINGKFYGGMQSLDELAALSGFVPASGGGGGGGGGSRAAVAKGNGGAKPIVDVDIPAGGGPKLQVGDDGCALSTGAEDCAK